MEWDWLGVPNCVRTRALRECPPAHQLVPCGKTSCVTSTWGQPHPGPWALQPLPEAHREFPSSLHSLPLLPLYIPLLHSPSSSLAGGWFSPPSACSPLSRKALNSPEQILVLLLSPKADLMSWRLSSAQSPFCFASPCTGLHTWRGCCQHLQLDFGALILTHF